MTAEWWWTIGVGITMVVGLCAVIVPILPGLLIMWAAALAYGFGVGWTPAGIAVMAALTVLAIISLITSVTVPRKAAAESGASGVAQLGGLVGAIIGAFMIPVIGLFIGGIVGVLLTEYGRNGSWDQAWIATKGTAKGFGVSMLIDIAAGAVMLALWLGWAALIVFG